MPRIDREYKILKTDAADKTADYLVVVVLDHSFQCDGMWKMPLKIVNNPKSANLSIVKNTPEIEIIIPTSIDWLK